MAMLQKKNTTGIKTTVTNKNNFKDKNGAFWRKKNKKIKIGEKKYWASQFYKKKLEYFRNDAVFTKNKK